MLKPLYGLDRRGLLRATAAGVVGATLPRRILLAGDSTSDKPVGLFAGAGIQGGQVLGQTDGQAAYPVTNSWSPADICSTIFNALGVEPGATLIDPLNRPHHLLNGNVISNLYTGATT